MGRRHHRSGRRRVKFWLPLAALLLVVLFVVFEVTLRPTIVSFAGIQAEWRINEAVQRGILSTFREDVNYQDLVYLERDTENRVVFMQANVIAINRLAAQANLAVQQSLEELRNDKFSIPVGQVLGSQLLANYGPPINITMLPIGSVQVGMEDSFEAAGINQTRHRIYLTVRGRIQVVVPLMGTSVRVTTRVPVADAVIVGPVPRTYLKLESGSLNPFSQPAK